MSYCRFSSDDFQCDVYVYESCMGGWQIHVAGSRYVFKEPLPPVIAWTEENAEACMARIRKVRDMVDQAGQVAIGLSCDGESFNERSPTDCANRLIYLRDLGYRVPQRAIDALLEEAA